MDRNAGRGGAGSLPRSSFATLFRHCLRFDVFERGPDLRGSALYTSALFGFLISLLFLVAAQSGELAAPEAAAMFLTLTALAAFPGILGEIAATLLDPRDVPFLSTLPTLPRSYFAARIAAIGLVLVHKTLAFGLLPAIYLAFREGSLAAAPVFLVVLCLFNLFIAAAAALLFLWVQRWLDPVRLRDVLVWIEVSLFVAGSAGWLLLFRTELDRSLGSLHPLWQSSALPSRWFADLYVWTTAQSVDARAAVAAVCCVLFVIALCYRVRDRYVALLAGLSAVHPGARSAPRPLRALFERCFVRSDERATFRLGLALMRRERGFRLQAYPLLAYPLLFLGFGLGKDDHGLFALSFSHFATLTLPLSQLFLRFSDHPQAGWWLRQFREWTGPSQSGARKAFLWVMVVPLYALVAALLVYDRGLWFGLWNGLIALFLATYFCVSRQFADPFLPFSSRFHGALETGKAVNRVYLLLALTLGMGFLQYWCGFHRPWTLPVLAALVASAAIFELRRRADPGDRVAPISAPRAVESDTSEPFPRRLSRELRALATMHLLVAVGAVLFGWLR